jgi:hypothetical protein
LPPIKSSTVTAFFGLGVALVAVWGGVCFSTRGATGGGTADLFFDAVLLGAASVTFGADAVVSVIAVVSGVMIVAGVVAAVGSGSDFFTGESV